MKKSSFMRKIMVLMMVLAVVVSYSVVPMNQSFAASGKRPAKVKSVKAVALGDSETSINVSWKKAKHAKKYQVYRATKKKGKYKKIATVKTTSYVNKGLKDGKKYYYKVRAVNGKKKGKFSKIKAATAKYVAPTPAPTPANIVEKDAKLGAVKSRKMTITVDMTDGTRYPKGNEIELWVPVPNGENGEPYQVVTNHSVTAWHADVAEFTVEENSGWHNKMAHIKWGKNTKPADRRATISFDVTRYAVSRPDAEEDPTADIPDEAKPFITLESSMVDLDNAYVQKYAKIAAGDATTTLGKAENIYNWIIDNLERLDVDDEFTGKDGTTVKFFNATGCGEGNPGNLLERFETYGRWGGHCTDLNSCFVALCRANGIAAREMFGIRLNDTSSDGQHCWAEFYLPGEGWTCADPGDVLKEARNHTADRSAAEIKEARNHPDVLAKKKALWLGVDGNRIVLSRGRDVVLNPAQKGETGRNTFGYPYAEMNGKHVDAKGVDIDCTKYKEFKYSITCAPIPTVVNADYVAANLGNVKLLDLRAKADYDIGHIPGAVSADVSKNVDPEGKGKDANPAIQNVSDAVADDPDGQKYVLICYSGNKYANEGRRILIEELGKSSDNLLILGQDDGTQGSKGGMNAWKGDIVPSVDPVAVNTVYVTPEWVRSAQAGEVDGYKDVKVLEVSYADPANKTYDNGHVPGAIKAYSIEVEDATGEPGQNKAYNLLSVTDIQDNLRAKGITANTKVVLYDAGGDPCEVGRQAYGYIVAGVKDVKILNGDLAAWKKAGYATETKANEAERTTAAFGSDGQLQYWTSMAKARAKLDSTDPLYNPDFKLISIRAEDEWLGITSGYSYMDKAGEPEGAVWGKGAQTAFDVADFINEDGTVKDLSGLKEVWKGCKFTVAGTPEAQKQHLSFYCGTGWRATVPFLVLYENGYGGHISVYDGGWYEWLMEDSNPVQVGAPGSGSCIYTTVGELPTGKAAK